MQLLWSGRAAGRSAAIIGGVLLIGLATPASLAMAALAPPTISFLGGTLAPVACSSKPDQATLTVPTGTRVVLANFTGADASVSTDGQQTANVADGAAISIKLHLGTHSLLMVPNCLTNLDVEPAVVTVVPGIDDSTPSPSPSPSPTPTEAPTGAPPPLGQPPLDQPSASAQAAGSSPGESAAPDGTTRDGTRPVAIGAGPRDGSATSAGTAVVTDQHATDQQGTGDDLEVTPVSVMRPLDGRGGRLLAVIALICVFGVTTAIIRAIVAQRTRGVTGR